VQCRTLCLSARFHLSGQHHIVDQPNDRTLEISGSHAFNLERPANRPTASGLSQTVSSWVQVCTATQLSLWYVGFETRRGPHQPQQIRLVRPFPATQAGANRRTHLSSVAKTVCTTNPSREGPRWGRSDWRARRYERANRRRQALPSAASARPSLHQVAPSPLHPSAWFSTIQR
jgi:hypothetical protein